MRITLCLALVLLPWLAQAAGPSPGPSRSACAQAYGSAQQRLAQAYAEQNESAAHEARRTMTSIVSRCQAAQRQYLEHTQVLERTVRLKRQQQQRTDERLRMQRLSQQRIEQQRLRQKRDLQRRDD
jgi:hypothetical protein